MPSIDPWSRRRFLQLAGLAGAGVTLGACGSEPESPTESASGETPSPVFTEPATQLSGSLSVLMWSHFVPSHDEWFDGFATDWGDQVGVDVRVDHIDVANVPTQIASEISAGQGHDLMQYIATLSQFEPSVLDMRDVTEEANSRYGEEQLAMCKESSYNPHTDKSLFGAIFTFTDAAVVSVLTEGKPTNSTHVLASWSFQRGIDGGDVGQGAVIALFLFPMLLAAAVLILRAVRRMETL